LTWRWKPLPEDKDKPVDEQNEKINRRRNKQQRQREYFVKWCDQSYWKCDWVSEVQVNIVKLFNNMFQFVVCIMYFLDGSFSSHNY